MVKPIAVYKSLPRHAVGFEKETDADCASIDFSFDEQKIIKNILKKKEPISFDIGWRFCSIDLLFNGLSLSLYLLLGNSMIVEEL